MVFRYAELYSITIQGHIFDANPLLAILKPFYENLPDVDIAVLTFVKTERLFGELGCVIDFFYMYEISQFDVQF